MCLHSMDVAWPSTDVARPFIDVAWPSIDVPALHGVDLDYQDVAWPSLAFICTQQGTRSNDPSKHG